MPPVIDDNTRRLASLLKALPAENECDPYPGATLLGHTIREKLVSAAVQDAALSITYRDHLPGLMVVDYFAHVLAGEMKICDNLRFIVEQARTRNPRPMLTLPLILVECGLRLKELPPDHLQSPATARRFQAREALPATLRPPEPFYLALAVMQREQLQPRHQEALCRAGSRQQIKAVVFTDAVLSLTPSEPAGQALERGDFLDASVHAAAALADWVTPALLQQHLTSLLSDQEQET
jgi:hypothetical protein